MNIDLDQTVELFSGEKAFSLIAGSLGFRTFTVDKDPATSPNLVSDIRLVSPDQVPQGPHLIWATPPGRALTSPDAWLDDDEPATKEVREAMEVLMAAGSLMAATKPMWWFLETPARLPRQRPLLAGFNRGYPNRIRHTISHEQYGGGAGRYSDIWTNAYWWSPTEIVSELAIPSSADSARVPPYVFVEIFEHLDNYRREQSELTAT